jgi:beta-lactamase class D
MAILKTMLFPVLMGFAVFCSAQNKSKPGNNATIAESISLRTDFNKYFDACNSSGCIVIFNNTQKQWITNDTVLMKTEKLPASTFKIINLLIALETGVIKDENELFKWNGEKDTVKYGFRLETYRDMTVKEAFEISTVWVFTDMAEKIGRENYSHYFNLCSYGNNNLTEPGTDFWNFGPFGISPLNQVNFIRDLYEGNLPFSERNMEIAKRIMITEKTENYTIRAKTGWTREGGINTGWWVGKVETKQGVWFFATLLLQDRKYNSPTFGPCRKEITKSVFRELGIIED